MLVSTWLIENTQGRRATIIVFISIIIITTTFPHEGQCANCQSQFFPAESTNSNSDFLIFQVRLCKQKRSSSIYQRLEDCKSYAALFSSKLYQPKTKIIKQCLMAMAAITLLSGFIPGCTVVVLFIFIFKPGALGILQAIG